MRPLRVHRVIARLNIGGPAMHVVHLARDLDRTGRYRTTLLTGRIGAEEGDMSWYATEHGVAPRTLDALGRDVRVGADFRTLWSLVRIFRAERPDIVHTHTAKAGALGRVAARLAGVPIVVHTYHGHVLGGDYFSPRKTRIYRSIERRLARTTDRLVALTPGQADELADDIGVAPREHFAVVPLGLDLGRFADADRASLRAETRAALGTPVGRRVVGIVGRLVPVKDHDLFLRSFARLLRDDTDVEAWIVGSGALETALKATSASLGIEGRVRWLGWRRDLHRLLPAMDVAALTSKDEGTAVVLLEAIAAGTPVAAVEVGGVSEVLRGAGLEEALLPAAAGRSPDGLARLLRRVLHHPLWAGGKGLPSAPRHHVLETYSTARLATDMDQLYRALVREKGLSIA